MPPVTPAARSAKDHITPPTGQMSPGRTLRSRPRHSSRGVQPLGRRWCRKAEEDEADTGHDRRAASDPATGRQNKVPVMAKRPGLSYSGRRIPGYVCDLLVSSARMLLHGAAPVGFGPAGRPKAGHGSGRVDSRPRRCGAPSAAMRPPPSLTGRWQQLEWRVA